jgi:hypothetical protein
MKTGNWGKQTGNGVEGHPDIDLKVIYYLYIPNAVKVYFINIPWRRKSTTVRQVIMSAPGIGY